MNTQFSNSFIRGFIKAAKNLSQEIEAAPGVAPAITNFGAGAAPTLAPWKGQYNDVVGSISNAANSARDLHTRFTTDLAKGISSNLPPSVGHSSFPESTRKVIADVAINHKDIGAAIDGKKDQAMTAVRSLTPELFNQTQRLQQEIDGVIKPQKELLDKVLANTGYSDLISGYDKLRKYDQLPWYQKMTGLHNSRPYLTKPEYQRAAEVAGDPVMSDVISQSVSSVPKAINVAKDVTQTPNMGTSAFRAAGWGVGKALTMKPVANWAAANAPILGRAAPLLGKAAPIPATIGLTTGVGAEMGQLAGKASVNGIGEVPKYFNEELSRQAAAPGLGGYLLAAENNMYKPVASMANYSRLASSPWDFLPLLSRDAWRGEHLPALPIPKIRPSAANVGPNYNRF